VTSDHKRLVVFMYSTHYCRLFKMKLEFSLRIFGKSSNIKFHEKMSIGSLGVPCGRTDGQTRRN